MNDTPKHAFEHIGAILPRALKTCQPDKIDTFLTVCCLWDEIVGKSVSENVRPAAYKKPILIVHANSSTWIHHLQFIKNDWIEKINKLLKSTVVTDIRCKIGPL